MNVSSLPYRDSFPGLFVCVWFNVQMGFVRLSHLVSPGVITETVACTLVDGRTPDRPGMQVSAISYLILFDEVTDSLWCQYKLDCACDCMYSTQPTFVFLLLWISAML